MKEHLIAEYSEIQKLRRLWSESLTRWGQVFIPVGAAIIAFFLSQVPGFVQRDWDLWFLLIGWVLLALCFGYWRWVVHDLDTGIVGLYPRMLEIEKELGMETQASYFFRHLKVDARKQLLRELKLEGDPRSITFRRLKGQLRDTGRDEQELYGGLLKIWDDLGYGSVDWRGHGRQVFVIVAFLLVLLALIIAGHFGDWWVALGNARSQ